MDLRKTGRLISKKRRTLNLTLGQLSEMLGVTPQAVHLWESGQRYPDVSSQIMIHEVLNLNPIELITGLEMFDEGLKRDISSYMNRIDEKVFVAGMVQDEDGNEEYLDLSDFMVMTTGKDGNSSDRWIPFSDYYNVEPPKEKLHDSSDVLKTLYDPTKIYLNHRHSFLTIPVELLEKLGNPLFFHIARKDENLLIVIEDEMSENSFDIPEKVYNGKWNGIRVHGGEFGHALCVEMGVRHYLDLLEITPEIYPQNGVMLIRLDEVKRSTADIKGADFLLPQWQYDELCEEDLFDEDCE